MLLALVAAQVFQLFMPEDVELVSAAERATALRNVIYTYVAGTLAAALFVWFAVPDSGAAQSNRSTAAAWPRIVSVVRRPAIWLQAVIVIAAYIGYKLTDNYGLFARDAYGLNEVDSAWLSTISAWVRPFAALLAGLIADRWLSSKVISAAFFTLVVVFGFMAAVPTVTGVVAVLVIEVVVACIAIYGLRGVYFALFEEAAVPASVTGTAVGIVSVVGYTPDIFFGLVAGYLLDTFPGVPGHQYVFAFVCLTSVIGLAASLLFTRLTRRGAAVP